MTQAPAGINPKPLAPFAATCANRQPEKERAGEGRRREDQQERDLILDGREQRGAGQDLPRPPPGELDDPDHHRGVEAGDEGGPQRLLPE